jgi:cell division protein FtsW
MTDILRGGPTGRSLTTRSRSAYSAWFHEIDRSLVAITLVLIAFGLFAVAAASPASAVRYSGTNVTFPPMYFFWRQALWVAISVPVMIAVSMAPTRLVSRIALPALPVCILLVGLAAIVGGEGTNGAARWIPLGFLSFQPSELLKPVFIVSTAWMLSLRADAPYLPMFSVTGAITALTAALLMLQPDFGQTFLLCSIWLVMVILAGIPFRAIAALIAAGFGGIVAAYCFYGTAQRRIDAFLFPSSDDTESTRFQIERAMETLTGGGLLGTGPTQGQAKFRLPEAHTDYIFAVIGEEFGLVACAVIAALFVALIIRAAVRLFDETDAFRLLAGAGITVQIGLQALISMMVNTGLAPAKGMTLPFISYGGSSMGAMAITTGLLLAFTRRNPYLAQSPYGSRWNGR